VSDAESDRDVRRRATRRIAAVLLALAACVAALIRVAPLGPSLDIVAFRTAHNP
jgi:ferric-dicitrate binding protein FerR (iron transport regulator)